MEDAVYEDEEEEKNLEDEGQTSKHYDGNESADDVVTSVFQAL